MFNHEACFALRGKASWLRRWESSLRLKAFAKSLTTLDESSALAINLEEIFSTG
jgi:hypothetical protein